MWKIVEDFVNVSEGQLVIINNNIRKYFVIIPYTITRTISFRYHQHFIVQDI